LDRREGVSEIVQSNGGQLGHLPRTLERMGKGIRIEGTAVVPIED
jgi:hypothetical protein